MRRLNGKIEHVFVTACALLFLAHAKHSIGVAANCTATTFENAHCVPAHAELAPLPPGPKCVECCSSCSYAQNTVCTGNHWDTAVPGRCPQDEEDIGDCEHEYGVTNVTITRRSTVCGFDSQGTPGSCGCKGPPIIDPITGQPVTDNVQVCQCIDS